MPTCAPGAAAPRTCSRTRRSSTTSRKTPAFTSAGGTHDHRGDHRAPRARAVDGLRRRASPPPQAAVPRRQQRRLRRGLDRDLRHGPAVEGDDEGCRIRGRQQQRLRLPGGGKGDERRGRAAEGREARREALRRRHARPRREHLDLSRRALLGAPLGQHSGICGVISLLHRAVAGAIVVLAVARAPDEVAMFEKYLRPKAERMKVAYELTPAPPETTTRVPLPDGKPSPVELIRLDLRGTEHLGDVQLFFSVASISNLYDLESLRLTPRPDGRVAFQARIALARWAGEAPYVLGTYRDPASMMRGR